MTRLQRELVIRTQTMGWTQAQLAEHLGGVYGVRSVEDLNFVQQHQFEAYLLAEWDRKFRETGARTRAEDAAVSDVPYIFRNGRG